MLNLNYFEGKYGKREKMYRRSYYIDSSLLGQLENISEIYRVNVPELINDSIEELIKTGDVQVYMRPEGELSIKYTVLIRESNLNGLEIFNKRYGISISKLVNIAIRNILNNHSIN